VYSRELGEPIFYPSSVFNFYSPNNPLPSAAGMPPGLLGPEFQIEGGSTAYLRDTLLDASALAGNEWTSSTTGIGGTIDLSLFVNVASDPTLLVDAFDAMMTHGQMPSAMRTILLTQVSKLQYPIPRANLAAYLIASASYFEVIH
jgi:hypothetical protein